MDILLLGGTAHLGAAVAIDALDRGHTVTCLARGTAEPPAGVTFVRGDRDTADGLAPVRGQHWDAVIDVARQPGQVRRAVAELSTAHWVFVSTGNVYADFSRPGYDETRPLLDPLQGEMMTSMADYGPAKVACEKAVQEGTQTAGGTATLARAGLIGGPGDDSSRVGYWPWRFAHPSGPDVLVPDDLDFPCAFIDVRDIAAWLVTAAEQRLEGPFNVAGEVTTLGEVLSAAARVAGAEVTGDPDAQASGGVPIRPVAAADLSRLEVRPWMGPRSMPLWIDDPQLRHFASMDTARARAAGLRTRPIAESLADALAYEQSRDLPRPAGLTDREEQEIRAALAG